MEYGRKGAHADTCDLLSAGCFPFDFVSNPVYMRRGMVDPRDDVSEANRRYYRAFEARSVVEMADIWWRDDRAYCVHPGWPVLRGYKEIVNSYEMIFRSQEPLNFFLSEQDAIVESGVAWLTLSENLITPNGTPLAVAVTNIFCFDRRRGWLLSGHHGSQIVIGLPT